VTDYAPIPDTKPVLYSQNTYTANWLTQIAKANKNIFDNQVLSLEHNLPVPLQPDITLTRLCELGARDPEVAWPVFLALWAELTAPGRPPIMMALDGLQYAMQHSLYRAEDYSPIHAHDLAILNHFTKCLSGAQAMPNGGAVVAATSRSHSPINPSVDIRAKQGWEKFSKKRVTPRDPYEKMYDQRVDEVLKSVEVIKLHGLSKVEARGLMEYWALSGVLRAQVDERTVTEKWTLAGGGIVGEIERGALRMRI
jgi:small subunit ribosomal protein S29